MILPLQYYLVWTEWYGLYSIFIPVYAFLLLPILAVLARRHDALPRAYGEGAVGPDDLRVLPVARAGAAHLTIPGYEDRNALLIVFLVLVVQSSDVFQYVWGKLFGKHKVAPAISPSKTVEGSVGRRAVGHGAGARSCGGSRRSTSWQAALMALAINVMGFFGGLVMSAIKRDRGVKDWGDLIEGHGGMLDRLDSVVFAAPVFFHLTRFWWT